MKHYVLLILSFAVGVFVSGAVPTQSINSIAFWNAENKPPTVINHQIPTLKQIQDLGQLVVLKVTIGDVIENNGHGYTAVYLVKGDGLIAVDFRRAELKDRNESLRLVTIKIPVPAVLQSRVDHEQTKSYDYRRNVWFGGNKDALRDASMRLAQRQVEQSCHSTEHIDRAKQNCELLLCMMYRFAGWNVQVEWLENVSSN